jgi:hypothetical protein
MMLSLPLVLGMVVCWVLSVLNVMSCARNDEDECLKDPVGAHHGAVDTAGMLDLVFVLRR